MAKNGDFYWVFAHVTPTFNNRKEITGFHSSRRKPDHRQVQIADGLYRRLKQEEDSHGDWKRGMAAATELLLKTLAAKGWSMTNSYSQSETMGAPWLRARV